MSRFFPTFSSRQHASLIHLLAYLLLGHYVPVNARVPCLHGQQLDSSHNPEWHRVVPYNEHCRCTLGGVNVKPTHYADDFMDIEPLEQIKHDCVVEGRCNADESLIGWDLTNRVHKAAANLSQTFIGPTTEIRSQCHGFITQWRYFPFRSLPFRAMILRNVSNLITTKYVITGINDIPAGAIDQVVTYEVPVEEQIVVRKGDVIGFAWDSPVISHGRDHEEACPILSSVVNSTDLNTGERLEDLSCTGKRAFSIQAVVSEDLGSIYATSAEPRMTTEGTTTGNRPATSDTTTMAIYADINITMTVTINNASMHVCYWDYSIGGGGYNNDSMADMAVLKGDEVRLECAKGSGGAIDEVTLYLDDNVIDLGGNSAAGSFMMADELMVASCIVDIRGESNGYFTIGVKIDVSEPADCHKIQKIHGRNKSGVYYIYPRPKTPGGTAEAVRMQVWCDMDTEDGGWTVIQRRDDGSVDFYRNWTSYADGFGDISGEYWLGNDNLYALTNNEDYEIRIDLDDGILTGYATYDWFKIEDYRNKYRLYVGEYINSRSTAGNSMAYYNPRDKHDFNHNSQQFSTYDNDNDGAIHDNCASYSKGGWWYSKCYAANLNGIFYLQVNNNNMQQGIRWNTWPNGFIPLRKVQMKVRPTIANP